jgi:hypothetical protein
VSVSAISTGSVLQSFQPQAIKNKFAKVQSEFQQIGQDLQVGNLAQAKTDFTTLMQDLPGAAQSTSSPVGQALGALGQALQSGDLSTAQQAYATAQQSVQKPGGHGGHHHHHHAQGTATTAASSTNPTDQLLAELGQALQSGDLSGAQQDFASLVQQYASPGGYAASLTGAAAFPAPGSTVNTTA